MERACVGDSSCQFVANLGREDLLHADKQATGSACRFSFAVHMDTHPTIMTSQLWPEMTMSRGPGVAPQLIPRGGKDLVPDLLTASTSLTRSRDLLLPQLVLVCKPRKHLLLAPRDLGPAYETADKTTADSWQESLRGLAREGIRRESRAYNTCIRCGSHVCMLW